MNKILPTIEKFRKEVIDVMISKGVEPPLPDSSEEQVLFDNWLAGWKKINQWKQENQE